ncbi:MAG TPA: ribosomal protein S18-alanine N-acetyltransferase [Gemmatimonas sp.]|nr:ribosomal protein S18-alanine N-acetyltransferase [Gemmatimonas sp.]
MATRCRPSDAFEGAEALSLRDACEADVAAMARIEAVAFSDPWPASAFSGLLEASHAMITVAVDATNEPVGYCVLLAAADEGEIANIAVVPSRRGQGVGARLLDNALRSAEHVGIRSVYLEVRTSNHAARDLYASRGFLAVGRRRAYYRNPLEDALVLRRTEPVSQ